MANRGYTDEQLIELIQDVSSLPTSTVGSNILLFLNTFGITDGDRKVSHRVLHKLYKSWSPSELKLVAFSNSLNYYLQSEKGFVSVNIDFSEVERLALKEKSKIAKPRHRTEKYQECIKHFVAAVNIKKGTTPIGCSSLYVVYKLYAPKYDWLKVSFHEFRMLLKWFCEVSYRETNQNFIVYINMKEVSDDFINAIKEVHEKERPKKDTKPTI